MKAEIKVNNPPKKYRKYIVVRLVDSSLWYYATYDTEEESGSQVPQGHRESSDNGTDGKRVKAKDAEMVTKQLQRVQFKDTYLKCNGVLD